MTKFFVNLSWLGKCLRNRSPEKFAISLSETVNRDAGRAFG
jgi:hypothetical protein